MKMRDGYKSMGMNSITTKTTATAVMLTSTGVSIATGTKNQKTTIMLGEEKHMDLLHRGRERNAVFVIWKTSVNGVTPTRNR
jgi:hypothetical protein